MQAGRELDALIAEKVFGLTCTREVQGFQKGMFGETINLGIISVTDAAPPYSTDIANAWLVVEKLGLLDGASLGRTRAGDWGIFEDWGGETITTAETVPLAICLAALKA